MCDGSWLSDYSLRAFLELYQDSWLFYAMLVLVIATGDNAPFSHNKIA